MDEHPAPNELDGTPEEGLNVTYDMQEAVLSGRIPVQDVPAPRFFPEADVSPQVRLPYEAAVYRTVIREMIAMQLMRHWLPELRMK